MEVKLLKMMQVSRTINPPPPSSSHSNRKIGIAALAVVVVAVVIAAVLLLGSSGGFFNIFPTPVPFNFSLAAYPNSGTVMQGQGIQTSVSISVTSGSSENVVLSASGGPDGVTYSFNPTTGTPDFESALTISVPESVPTNPYSFVITATAGDFTQSVSYALSVLSAKVAVSGTVTTVGLGTHPTEIKFVDVDSGVTYTASMSGNSYYITLQNQHTYNVVCTWAGLLWSTGTFSGGKMTVYAGVGSTSMNQDFSG